MMSIRSKKSVVSLTDRPDMTLAISHGRKATAKQHLSFCIVHGFILLFLLLFSNLILFLYRSISNLLLAR